MASMLTRILIRGQAEAFAASVFAVIDPGDVVLLFDPSYETYDWCIRMAGGTLYMWRLTFLLDFGFGQIRGVFHWQDKSCHIEQVYEHITYDNIKHICLASLPGMQEQTIITSSLSKGFSVTGWRVGWAIAPSFFASAIGSIHVKLTDSAPAPFQEAALTALSSPPEYYESLRSDYESKRDYIANLLAKIGFQTQFKPKGSVFLSVEIPETSSLSDVEYVKELMEQAGVVAVPGCAFFHTNLSVEKSSQVGYNYQKRYIRFAFCKNRETLIGAAKKLGELQMVKGESKC